MKYSIYSFLICILIGSIQAKAQNIDNLVKERIIRKLNSLNPSVRVKNITVNLIIEESNVKAIIDSIKELPGVYQKETYRNTNCTNKPKGWDENLSMSISTTESLSITESYSSTSSLSVNISFPFEIGGSTTASYSRTLSFSQSQNWSQTKNETRSRTINTTVDPFSVLYIQLSSYSTPIQIPFKGDFKVNGTIEVEWEMYIKPFKKWTDAYPNFKTSISNILHNDERLFSLSGFYVNSKATEINVRYSTKPLTAEFCNSSLQLEKHDDLSKQSEIFTKALEGKKLTKKEMDILSTPSPNPSESKCQKIESAEADTIKFNQVIEPYIDNIRITTNESVANIEVRHTSFGPGFCNVITRTQHGHQVGVNAPPFIWTGWQILTSHIGSVTFQISNQVNCDTGVKSEVRYYKK